MGQSGTAIVSELLDLGGVTLEQLRTFDAREREREKTRLLQKLDDRDIRLAGSQGS